MTNFFDENSLHDAIINKITYSREENKIVFSVMQLYSELSIQSNVHINSDDIVEVCIEINNVKYYGANRESYDDYEIYSVDYGVIGDSDFVIFKVTTDTDYSEFFIRGQGMSVEAQIIQVSHWV